MTSEPPNANRDARLYMLALWSISLGLTSVTPYLTQTVGMESGLAGGLFAALCLLTSCVMAFLVAFTWRTRAATPLAYWVCAACGGVLLSLGAALDRGESALMIQSLAAFSMSVGLNVLIMAATFGLVMTWRGRHGRVMLVSASLMLAIGPLVLASATSVQNAVLLLAGQAGSTVVQSTIVSALCGATLGIGALIARLLRGVRSQL